MTGADLIELFSLARSSGSLIVGPTFAGWGWGWGWSITRLGPKDAMEMPWKKLRILLGWTLDVSAPLKNPVDSVVQGSLEVDVMWPLPTGKQDEFTGRNRAMTIMIGAYWTLEIGNCWFSFHPDFSLILGRGTGMQSWLTYTMSLLAQWLRWMTSGNFTLCFLRLVKNCLSSHTLPIEISKLCRVLVILDLGSSLNDTAHCRPSLV